MEKQEQARKNLCLIYGAFAVAAVVLFVVAPAVWCAASSALGWHVPVWHIHIGSATVEIQKGLLLYFCVHLAYAFYAMAHQWQARQIIVYEDDFVVPGLDGSILNPCFEGN